MPIHYCYILYSPTLDSFYVGQAVDPHIRLIEHNEGKYDKSYTTKVSDWEHYLLIECHSKTQAIKIESFIKRMKSKKFIERLKHEQQIIKDVLDRFKQ
jgi:putative endonuclease